MAAWMRTARRALAAALLLAPAVAGAEAPTATRLAPMLVSESGAPAPGQPVRLALRMTPTPGWHGYWVNPGDAGLTVEPRWTLPKGVQVEPFAHPAPSFSEAMGVASYVHEGAFTLLAEMILSDDLAPGDALPVAVDLTWLACSDTLCVPEQAALALDLTIGDGALDPQAAPLFAAADAALPLRHDGVAEVARSGDDWLIRVDDAAGIDADSAWFAPASPGWYAAAARQRAVEGADGALEIRAPALGDAPSDRLRGVLTDGARSIAVAAPVGEPVAGQTAPPRSSLPEGDLPAPKPPALWAALGGAVLGGLLLNLMPCVFPILSLKALSLARAGGDGRAARIEGAAYVIGGTATAAALGGVLLAMRALGQEVGWSFQLQDPRVVAVLLLLTLAIALNLAGLYEVHGPSLSGGLLARTDAVGGFAAGAIAALVATPCSGPFMGAALGAALVLPTSAALTLFAGLGFGMTLPFAAIAFIPALRNRLPRPGPWMETFRRILAAPMLLTALGLAWVLGRQAGADGQSIGLLLALGVSLALWALGARQRRGQGAGWTLAPAAIAIALAVATPWPSAAPAEQRPGAEVFTQERFEALRAAGAPVFVDVTAAWCVTCQINKAAAIDRASTRAAFEAAGVRMLVADWTTGDPAITAWLAERGRNAIPYYLFVHSDGRVEELPPVLTTAMLVSRAKP